MRKGKEEYGEGEEQIMRKGRGWGEWRVGDRGEGEGKRFGRVESWGWG